MGGGGGVVGGGGGAVGADSFLAVANSRTITSSELQSIHAKTYIILWSSPISLKTTDLWIFKCQACLSGIASEYCWKSLLQWYSNPNKDSIESLNESFDMKKCRCLQPQFNPGLTHDYI